jgi:hypothetical protein
MTNPSINQSDKYQNPTTRLPAIIIHLALELLYRVLDHFPDPHTPQSADSIVQTLHIPRQGAKVDGHLGRGLLPDPVAQLIYF